MTEESLIHVSLDRIEEGVAVLITEQGASLSLPADCLPAGAREGDVLDLIIRRNPAETEKLADRVEELQNLLLERTRRRHAGENEE
jgi:hypothetical protein